MKRDKANEIKPLEFGKLEIRRLFRGYVREFESWVRLGQKVTFPF